MNLDWLQSFLTTVTCKSLSKASEQLSLSQPAVSKQIRKLEEVLGVTLFHRTTQGMELTPAGDLFYERIQPLLSELHAIRADLQQFQTSQLIKIGTFPSLVSTYLPQKMVALQQQQIEVHVAIQHTSEELLASLHSGVIDLAILECHGVPDSLWQMELFTEPYVVLLPKKHRLSGMETLSIEDLQGEEIIVHPETCNIRRTIFQQYRERGFEPKIASEVDFGHFIIGLVEAGAGYTIVPQIMANPHQHPGLAILPLADFHATRTISLVSKSKQLGQNVFQSFQQHFHQQT